MSWKGSGSMMFLLACTATLLMASWEVLADGDKSIAGVLDGLYDEFEFLGSEGQVLFAELKAENYQNRGRNGGSGGGGCSDGGTGGCSCDSGSGGGSCDSGSGGGCSDGGSSGCTCDSESTTSCSDDGSSGCSCDDTTGDDCSGGGSGGGGSSDLCLQVVDIYGDKVCWAGRPARPGWQRDPRLGCPLPAGGTYFLRVFVGQCGSTDTSTYQDADSFDSPRFYRLYLTLMDVEDEGLILEPKEPKEQ